MAARVDLVAIPVEDLPPSHPDAPRRPKPKQLTGAEFTVRFLAGTAGAFAAAAAIAAAITSTR